MPEPPMMPNTACVIPAPPCSPRATWLKLCQFYGGFGTWVVGAMCAKALATHSASSWRRPGPIPRGLSAVDGVSPEQPVVAKHLPGVMGPGFRQDDPGE